MTKRYDRWNDERKRRIYEKWNGRLRRAEFLRRLKDAYEPTIWALMSHFELDDPDDARDAIHSVLAYILKRLDEGRVLKPIRNFRRFLVKAAINAYKRRYKEKVRLVLWEDLPEEDQAKIKEIPGPERSPLQIVMDRELAALAWKELWGLPPRQRIVLYLRFSGGSFREIAKQLRLSLNAVKVHAHLGLKELRRRLGHAA